MTKPLNVQVVPEELMARAAELESVVAVPAVNPATPCALPMITTAAASLAFSGNAMQTYLDAGNKARRQLADALRQAAKAYTGTDEQAAQALNGEGGGVSGMRRAGATASEAPAGRRLGDYAPGTGPGPDPCGPGPVVPPGGATPPPYYPVRQAAEEIAAPDQGAAFSAFAQAWTAVQQPLLDSTNAFRPFQNWQGTAASAVEANFEQYRQWVYSMVKMCQQLVTQAQGVTTAHSWAITQHPTVAQLDKLDADWNRLEAYKLALPKMFFAFEWQRQQAENEVRLEEKSFLKAYAKLQSQSESVLAEYYKKANLPLTALDPQAPPAAYSPPPPAPAPIAPNPGPSPSPAPTPTPGSIPGSGSLPGMPMMGGIPSLGGIPSAPTATMAAATPLPGGPGLRPAALGGGAGGGIPLSTAPGAEAARPAAAAGDVEALGRANGGAGGAATGRGGMGMAPVGHGGHGQSGNKGKREPADDESLYTEDRAWTEAVIGRQEPDETPTATKWASEDMESVRIAGFPRD